MVPRPNLGGDFTFLLHSPLGRGILSFATTVVIPLGIKMKFNSDVLLGHN